MTLRQTSFPTEYTGAEFSPCRQWRYALWRNWDLSRRIVAFIGLNPSTADETENDPTVRRCIAFAKRWGYGGMVMLNAFAYRATDPRDMKAVDDPVGPQNDFTLRQRTREAALVVAAWGNHGTHRNRDRAILELGLGVLHCLGETNACQPRHPLYLPKTSKPRVWRYNSSNQ